jgi:hypothetical protein
MALRALGFGLGLNLVKKKAKFLSHQRQTLQHRQVGIGLENRSIRPEMSRRRFSFLP